jgi:hypothetical protein
MLPRLVHVNEDYVEHLADVVVGAPHLVASIRTDKSQLDLDMSNLLEQPAIESQGGM